MHVKNFASFLKERYLSEYYPAIDIFPDISGTSYHLKDFIIV